jgi:hypothetical protein
MIAEELSLQLLGDFEDSEGTYLEFNLAEKLRGSFEEQAAQLQASVGGPFMTRNEARATQNLPAIDGGDELIVPLNVIEGGQASPQDSAPDTGALSGPRSLVKGSKPAGPALVKVTPSDRELEEREDVVDIFDAFFRRQRETVLSAIGAGGDWWDADRWNEELAADLYGYAVKMASLMGPEMAEELGFSPDSFDLERTLAFLHAFAELRAQWVNETTREQLETVLADESEDAPEPAAVFDVAEAQRAEASGSSSFSALTSFITLEVGRQVLGDGWKTWRTNSGNSRRSHARMDGERVRLKEKFSNGLDWPGDPVKGPDEVAGCRCSVEVTPLEEDENEEETP